MWLTAPLIFDGEVLRSDHAVRIEEQTVVDLAPAPHDAHPVGEIICPGFVDLQINGGGGVLLNNDPSLQGVRTILAAHRAFGTVAALPTVITDTPDVMTRAADAVLSCPEAPGLHIEGPHIAMSKRGTHAATHIRPLNQSTLDCVERLRDGGKRVLLTVAPEVVTPAEIGSLVAMACVVSLGHSDATVETVQDALRAGATCGTHLYNAMSPMHSRAPGMVGALINSDAYLSVICDGHHVSDDMIALACRARPKTGRMMLVSDAMATVGGGDQFELYGEDIQLEDGRLINADGNLAGAHLTQAAGLKRLVKHVGVPLEDALRMVISVPAQAISVPEWGSLVGRRVDDVVALSKEFNVRGPLSAV